MGRARIIDKLGKDISDDGSPLNVKISDGTDEADVELFINQVDNLDGKKGLLTKAEGYGRLDSGKSLPLRIGYAENDAHPVASIYPQIVLGYNFGFNGTSWDRFGIDGATNRNLNVRIRDGARNAGIVQTPNDAIANTDLDAIKVFSALQGYDAGNWKRLRCDAITNTLVSCDLDTYMLHQEKQFVASHIFSAVATTNIVYMRIMPHATTDCHFGYIIMSDGECKIEVVEGTTYNTDGTAVTAYNRYRASGNTTDQLIYQTPTINVLGTVISVNILGSAGKFTGSGDRLNSSDWHLKASTDILLKITNISTDNSEIVVKFNFMEA